MLRDLVNGMTEAGGIAIMVILIVATVWLVGIFAWHWGKIALRSAVRQVLCLLGHAHRTPEVHRPEWDERAIRVKRHGPLKDHWWSTERYYASIEYECCRHKGCKVFRITRIVKDV